MKQALFSDFPPVATAEWEEKIREDLKGADYEKKLVWDTQQGYRVKPYYRAEALEGLEHLDVVPGRFPFARGNKKSGNPWYIRQDITVGKLKEANEKALDILMKGVDSLGFLLDGDRNYEKEDLDVLLRNIFAEIVEINFECGRNAEKVLAAHIEMIRRYNRDFQKIHGSVDYDPLGRLVTTGNFYGSEAEDFETCTRLIRLALNLPHFTVIRVGGHHFHDAGASAVESLAFSLAAGAEYLTRLTEMGLSVNEVAPKIKFTVSTGSDYFSGLAAIRATRLLWAHIVKAYGPISEDTARLNIHAVTSRWNKTVYDPYVNMLRTTTEAMSSILAGVDSLTVLPFDIIRDESSEFSERIARNQQLLLKEESYFDQVADPASGSYYIESLTNAIAGEAWKLFLETDARGGLIEAFKQGFIQDRIEATAERRKAEIAVRKQVILGVNQYPDFGESNTEARGISNGSSGSGQAAEHLARPLVSSRGAEAFEALRSRTDRYAMRHKRPAAFMLTIGNLAMRIARSQFSRNFFACAGFEVIDNLGFSNIEEGVNACLASGAEIVVICSSDEEYAAVAPEIAGLLKGKAIIVVAGYPKESLEQLKAAGIEHFIHVRANVLEELQGFQQMIGI